MASNRPNVGYFSKKLSHHGTMVFFPLGLRRMSPGPNIWLKGRTGRTPLCKSHAFNIIQLQLGSSDKIWFKVTRGDQNASLKVVQALFYKMDSRIIKGDVFGTVGLKSHVLQRFGARGCSWDRYSGVVSVRSHRHQITMIWNIIVGIYWVCS